jgi:hypothetical protein
MTYTQKIAALFDKHVSNRPSGDSLVPLLAALGCMHVFDPVGGSGGTLVRPGVIAPIHEKLVRKTLVQTMHAHVRRSGDFSSDEDLALLGALVQHDRWRECLQTMDGAIDFGLLLSYFFVSDPTIGGQALMEAIGPAVFEIVNTWLAPVPLFQAYDSNRAASYDLAVCLFGELWCSLVLADLQESPQDIPERLRLLRPPVLEHLLPDKLHVKAAALPELEGNSYV